MIVCAAIFDRKSQRVFGGIDYISILSSLNWIGYELGADDFIVGFLDQDGEFLDGIRAYKEAIMCGQVGRSLVEMKESEKEDCLYPEDLY